MSRGKVGRKAGRAERDATFQRHLKMRKRLRKERREATLGVISSANFRMIGEPGIAKSQKHYTRPELERMQIGPLRDIAKERGVMVGRVRKAALIDAILDA